MRSNRQADISRTPHGALPNEPEQLPPELGARLAGALVSVLGVIGLIISSYLPYVRWRFLQFIQAEIGNCVLVNSSKYSEMLGMPVGILGIFVYSWLFILGLLNIWRHQDFSPIVPLDIFGLALMGVLFNAWASYVEIFTLHATCWWCISSGLTMSAALLSSIVLLGSVARARPVALSHHLQ